MTTLFCPHQQPFIINVTYSTEVQLAENLDAEGRHREAIDKLTAAAEKGDLEAQTQLGKRMIIGDRAPNMPKEGVGLIVQAAENGGPEALCLLSVLFAVGMYVRQDWRQAINALRLSAEKGWQPAQTQLKTLTHKRHLADTTRNDREYWLELANAVDVNSWFVAPPANTLNESPLIRTFPNFVNQNVCRWLIDKSRHRLTRAQVYDAVKRTVTENHTRTNSAAIFNLVETDLVNLLIQMRIAACTGVNFRQMETATVLHYAIGEQITEHYDFIDPNTPNYAQIIQEQGQRIITFMIYLNDDYQGGATEFPALNISHKGKQGEGIFFVNALPDGSSDLRTLHAGRPPQAGEKWLATQFIRSSFAL